MSIHAPIEKGASERFAIGLNYLPPDIIEGNPIIGATASVSPTELELIGDPVITTNQVTQMIGGGVKGTVYTVQFSVTLQDTSVYASPVYDALVINII